MSRYPHDWSIDALSCRACGVPRLHADPSAPCVAALVARVEELERHVGSLHKATARGMAHERAVVVAWLRRQNPLLRALRLAADAIERGEHLEGA